MAASRHTPHLKRARPGLERISRQKHSSLNASSLRCHPWGTAAPLAPPLARDGFSFFGRRYSYGGTWIIAKRCCGTLAIAAEHRKAGDTRYPFFQHLFFFCRCRRHLSWGFKMVLSLAIPSPRSRWEGSRRGVWARGNPPSLARVVVRKKGRASPRVSRSVVVVAPKGIGREPQLPTLP